jgi:hypothetical protein
VPVPPWPCPGEWLNGSGVNEEEGGTDGAAGHDRAAA